MMNYRMAETAYLQKRRLASLAMADASTGRCARVAHETLAGLYLDRLDRLAKPSKGDLALNATATEPRGAGRCVNAEPLMLGIIRAKAGRIATSLRF